MRILVSAIAISAFGIGAALAAPLTESDAQRVRQIVPEANLTMLSDEQSALLSTFVNQDDFGRSPSDADYIRAVLYGNLSGTMVDPVTLSAGDAERIVVLIPSADLTMLNAEQVQMLSTFVNSSQYARGPSAEAYVTAVLSGELSMTPEAPGMLSTSDAERVRFLLPDANLTGLTEGQVAELSAFVNSSDYGSNPSDVEFLRSVLKG